MAVIVIKSMLQESSVTLYFAWYFCMALWSYLLVEEWWLEASKSMLTLTSFRMSHALSTLSIHYFPMAHRILHNDKPSSKDNPHSSVIFLLVSGSQTKDVTEISPHVSKENLSSSLLFISFAFARYQNPTLNRFTHTNKASNGLLLGE